MASFYGHIHTILGHNKAHVICWEKWGDRVNSSWNTLRDDTKTVGHPYSTQARVMRACLSVQPSGSPTPTGLGLIGCLKHCWHLLLQLIGNWEQIWWWGQNIDLFGGREVVLLGVEAQRGYATRNNPVLGEVHSDFSWFRGRQRRYSLEIVMSAPIKARYPFWGSKGI